MSPRHSRVATYMTSGNTNSILRTEVLCILRIIVDMDGVLCDLIGKWFTTYNEEYQDSLTAEQMTVWGPHHYARAGKRIYKYLSQPGFFRDLAPLPGAVSGMRWLVESGLDVVIVTAARRGHRDKLGWISEHLPFLPRDNVIFAHRKELVRADIMFDDAPHNLENFARYGQPIAMAHPYNANVTCPRVDSWAQFVELIAARAGLANQP